MTVQTEAADPRDDLSRPLAGERLRFSVREAGADDCAVGERVRVVYAGKGTKNADGTYQVGVRSCTAVKTG